MTTEKREQGFENPGTYRADEIQDSNADCQVADYQSETFEPFPLQQKRFN